MWCRVEFARIIALSSDDSRNSLLAHMLLSSILNDVQSRESTCDFIGESSAVATHCGWKHRRRFGFFVCSLLLLSPQAAHEFHMNAEQAHTRKSTEWDEIISSEGEEEDCKLICRVRKIFLSSIFVLESEKSEEEESPQKHATSNVKSRDLFKDLFCRHSNRSFK